MTQDTFMISQEDLTEDMYHAFTNFKTNVLNLGKPIKQSPLGWLQTTMHFQIKKYIHEPGRIKAFQVPTPRGLSVPYLKFFEDVNEMSFIELGNSLIARWLKDPVQPYLYRDLNDFVHKTVPQAQRLISKDLQNVYLRTSMSTDLIQHREDIGKCFTYASVLTWCYQETIMNFKRYKTIVSQLQKGQTPKIFQGLDRNNRIMVKASFKNLDMTMTALSKYLYIVTSVEHSFCSTVYELVKDTKK